MYKRSTTLQLIHINILPSDNVNNICATSTTSRVIGLAVNRTVHYQLLSNVTKTNINIKITYHSTIAVSITIGFDDRHALYVLHYE